MNINHKQKELIDEIFNKVIKKYPEIKFLNLSKNPDDIEHIWINVLTPMDEEKEIELRHFSSELEVDIFDNYGYKISIMTEYPNLIYT